MVALLLHHNVSAQLSWLLFLWHGRVVQSQPCLGDCLDSEPQWAGDCLMRRTLARSAAILSLVVVQLPKRLN